MPSVCAGPYFFCHSKVLPFHKGKVKRKKETKGKIQMYGQDSSKSRHGLAPLAQYEIYPF